MFSARFEEALLSASDEELHHFFAELPRAARRRLVAVLAKVDAASAQHYLDTNHLDDDADLAELSWPSDPEPSAADQLPQEPSDESSDVSLESWGIFGGPTHPAGQAVFGASAGTPTAASSDRSITGRLAASSSSDPAPLHLLNVQQCHPQHSPLLRHPVQTRRLFISSRPRRPSVQRRRLLLAAQPLSRPSRIRLLRARFSLALNHAPAEMRWASPTVPPPPDLRRRRFQGPVCKRSCDNPQCTDFCPRVDDPSRSSGHRRHACDAHSQYLGMPVWPYRVGANQGHSKDAVSRNPELATATAVSFFDPRLRLVLPDVELGQTAARNGRPLEIPP